VFREVLMTDASAPARVRITDFQSAKRNGERWAS
jgi:hypothetical protein